jgi:RNA polymerase sigma-70 factor (ECF subfamily)
MTIAVEGHRVTEGAVVRAAAAGDRDAFGALAATRVDGLYATATLILRDRSQAEDAVQDALVRAWRDLPRLRDHERFDAWLRRVLVNACRDASRRGRRHESNVMLEPGHDRPTPDHAAAADDRDAVHRGLGRLSHDHRTALVLFYYLDLSLPEMAEVLNIPTGTAKSRLHHARQALKVAIAGHAEQRGIT